MIGRIVVFGAGAAVGVYGTVKARRLAYRLSTPGLADQAAAWRLGIAEFRKEFADGQDARRAEQLRRLGAHLYSVDTTDSVDTPDSIEEHPA